MKTSWGFARRGWMVGVLGVAVLGCAAAPDRSSSGYTGTWTMGNERIRSMVYIVDNDRGTWFRWRRWSADGKHRVDCNWEGRCEGVNEGVTYGEYHFTVWKDAETGNLMVEGRRTLFAQEKDEMHYVDELVLEEDGLTLLSYSNEQQGQVYEGAERPLRRFKKVSDSVPDPPVGAFPR